MAERLSYQIRRGPMILLALCEGQMDIVPRTVRVCTKLGMEL